MENVRESVRVVRDAAAEAGKAPDAVRCVVRAVTVLRDRPVEGERKRFTGSLDQLRDDLASYATLGVDEVFLDLNFDSERVGNPSGDPSVGMDLFARLLPLAAERY
jgi:alkanesulfonate monooxygenase SsuD/methylene tetrahydromethanopterin reductase-like flavin-dependent oxidoreductase (luciferase family)